MDSYGTGDKVKLPGPSVDKPNVYDFGTSYEEIYSDLSKWDKSMYTQVSDLPKSCSAAAKIEMPKKYQRISRVVRDLMRPPI